MCSLLQHIEWVGLSVQANIKFTMLDRNKLHQASIRAVMKTDFLKGKRNWLWHISFFGGTLNTILLVLFSVDKKEFWKSKNPVFISASERNEYQYHTCLNCSSKLQFCWVPKSEGLLDCDWLVGVGCKTIWWNLCFDTFLATIDKVTV